MKWRRRFFTFSLQLCLLHSCNGFSIANQGDQTTTAVVAQDAVGKDQELLPPEDGENRLIFDLGDITINFIPVLLAAKLVLGILWLLGEKDEEVYYSDSPSSSYSGGSSFTSSSGYGAPSTGYGYASSSSQTAPGFSSPSSSYGVAASSRYQFQAQNGLDYDYNSGVQQHQQYGQQIQGRLEGQTEYGQHHSDEVPTSTSGDFWETAGNLMSGLADAAVSVGNMVGGILGIGGDYNSDHEHVVRFTDTNGQDITDQVIFLDDDPTRAQNLHDAYGHYYRSADRRSSLEDDANDSQDYSHDYYDYQQDQPDQQDYRSLDTPGGGYRQSFNWNSGDKNVVDSDAYKQSHDEKSWQSDHDDLNDDYYADEADAGLAGEPFTPDDIIRPSTRVDSIQDILATRRKKLDHILTPKNDVVGELLAERRRRKKDGLDRETPATIQKILSETHGGILPKQTVTLDDIFRDSQKGLKQIEIPEEEDEMTTKRVFEKHHRRRVASMDSDKQPRLETGGFMPVNLRFF